MKISLDNSTANTIIAYDVGMVRVHTRGGQDQAKVLQVTHSTIITPERLIEDWLPERPSQLIASHMQAVLAFQPEIVILGTGRRLSFPGNEIIQACHRAGAGFEVMDTGAACRTYNILAAEGRRVAAALLMIEMESE